MNSNVQSISFAPFRRNFTDIEKGYQFGAYFRFRDNNDGTAVDITPDDFAMKIKESDGTILKTLTIGSGLSFGVDVNKLDFTIDTDVTDNAGVYTYVLEWTRAGASNPFPVAFGQIVVKQTM